MRYRAASLLPCLTFCAGTTIAAPARWAPPDPLPPDVCLERLDAAVEQARRGAVGRARLALERLAPHCEHVPQIHHNLGVIAARADRLPAALAHFEAALDADPRAAMTLEHVRALHRREAALGYARALGRPGDVPRSPPLALQDSRDVGADTLLEGRIADDPRRDVATLEYELYAWWRSAREGDADERLAHYVDGYPRRDALAGRGSELPWEDVRRDIAFASEDAVVVLAYADASAAADTVRRLLMLRLEGDRWRIYRDTTL